MAILKKLDLFRSISAEYKEGSTLGSLFTLVGICVAVFFFAREINEYKSENLTTKLYVQNLNEYMIEFNFDITVFKMDCERLIVRMKNEWDEKTVNKTPHEETGCHIVGRYYLKHMDNELYIQPDIGSTIMDMFAFQSGNAEDAGKGIDMSHRINHFQFGRSNWRTKELETKFPDMIKSNPLDGLTYIADNSKDGHSVFLYEMNVVTTKIDGGFEVIYNYNKNTITSQQTQPRLNFIIDFSPIAIEYIQHTTNFLEFLTYLLGIVGGILAIIKFLANLILGFVKPRKSEEAAKIMEM
jgi:hypothetical protein